jgi:hypothetical protein
LKSALANLVTHYFSEFSPAKIPVLLIKSTDLCFYQFRVNKINVCLEYLCRENINKNTLRINKNILRRNCLLQRVTEGKIKGWIEVAGGRGRRRRKLLDDLKERRGYSHLNEESLDRTIWRARFGRGFGPVVRQTT